jgi:hypothetical protein
MLEETILHQILLELGMVVEEEQHKQLSIWTLQPHSQTLY